VQKCVNCEPLELPFGLVSGGAPGIGVLDGVYMPKGKGGFGRGYLPIGLNGVFECIFKTEAYLTGM